MKKEFALAGEAVALCALTLAGTLIFYRLWRLDPMVAGENQLMEWLQAIFLGVASVVCLAKLFPGKLGKTEVPFGFLLLFFLTFFLREVDIEKSDLPRWIIALTSGSGRNALMGLSWLGYGVHCLRNRATWWPVMRGFFVSRPGVYFFVGVLFYLAGYPFDKEIFALTKPQNRFLEELFELAGTLFFLLSVGWAVVRAKRPS